MSDIMIEKAGSVNIFRGSRLELLEGLQTIANRRSKDIRGWTYKTANEKVIAFSTMYEIGATIKKALGLGASEPFEVEDANKETLRRNWTKNRSRS